MSPIGTDTSKPTGIGVIGCGVISDIYLRNIARFSQLALVGVADLDMEAARKRAHEHNTIALSPEALLAREDVEIVLNLTIPAAHVAVGLAALEAGKHVYSEKPMAGTVADARRLMDAAQARGLRLGCAPDTFLGGSHQTARALVDAGRIGTPTAGTATLMLPGHEAWHPNPDFYYAGAGAGPMMDMGPYYVTAMINLLGPVRRVTAFGARGRDTRVIATGPRAGQTIPVEVPTHITGVMEFAGGALVQIVTSFDVTAHRHSPLELYGTKGALVIPDPNRFDGEVALFEDGWTPQPLSHAYGDDNYRALGLADMAQGLREGRPHRASGALGLHALEVMEAISASAQDGRVITLDTTCDRPAPLPPEGLPGGLSGGVETAKELHA
ncbi:Gfo/Idh/MocA family oxidoreductase [Rhodobacteraceae bacterium]|nr:Gfo/Idh/MocA family oxidoreductase [Paracoccaceae bacterium]